MAARSINPTSRSLAGLSNGDPAPAGMTPGWWVDAAGNVAAIVSQPGGLQVRGVSGGSGVPSTWCTQLDITDAGPGVPAHSRLINCTARDASAAVLVGALVDVYVVPGSDLLGSCAGSVAVGSEVETMPGAVPTPGTVQRSHGVYATGVGGAFALTVTAAAAGPARIYARVGSQQATAIDVTFL